MEPAAPGTGTKTISCRDIPGRVGTGCLARARRRAPLRPPVNGVIHFTLGTAAFMAPVIIAGGITFIESIVAVRRFTPVPAVVAGTKVMPVERAAAEKYSAAAREKAAAAVL